MTPSRRSDRPGLGAETDTVARRSGSVTGTPPEGGGSGGDPDSGGPAGGRVIPRDVPEDEYGLPSDRPVSGDDVPELPGLPEAGPAGGPESGRPAGGPAEEEPGADAGPGS